jgi:hypothetical protein
MGRITMTAVVCALLAGVLLAGDARVAFACECCARSTEWSRLTRRPNERESGEVAKLITLTGLIEENSGKAAVHFDSTDPVHIAGRRDDRGGWRFRLQGETGSTINRAVFLFIPSLEWEFFRTYDGPWQDAINADVSLYKEVVIPGAILFEGPAAQSLGISRREARLVLKGRGNNCFSHEDLKQWTLYFEVQHQDRRASFAADGVVSEVAFSAVSGDNLLSYKNRSLGVGFDYPLAWGKVVFHDYRSRQEQGSAGTPDADYTLAFDSLTGDLSVTIYYGLTHSGPPTTPDTSGGEVDTTSAQEDNRSSGDITIGGNRATIEDRYVDDSETMKRTYSLALDGHQVEIRVSIVVASFATDSGLTREGLDYFLALNATDGQLNTFVAEVSDFLNSIAFDG